MSHDQAVGKWPIAGTEQARSTFKGKTLIYITASLSSMSVFPISPHICKVVATSWILVKCFSYGWTTLYITAAYKTLHLVPRLQWYHTAHSPISPLSCTTNYSAIYTHSTPLCFLSVTLLSSRFNEKTFFFSLGACAFYVCRFKSCCNCQ